ncbi:MAG TPA: hypothetical protein VE420_04965 [Gemmatimonadales bacterium]|nr:hypothetical protein [Gemmatimonadales bacterium]
MKRSGGNGTRRCCDKQRSQARIISSRRTSGRIGKKHLTRFVAYYLVSTDT